MQVHRHLLTDRAKSAGDTTLRSLIEKADNEPGSDDLRIILLNLEERALEIYAASLYGRPMIWDDIDERHLDQEYQSLVQIHVCCGSVVDTDGQDESMDALRHLLKEKGDDLETPIGFAFSEGCEHDSRLFGMIIDFVVYGKCCEALLWLDAYLPLPALQYTHYKFVHRLCDELMRKARLERCGKFKEVVTADDLDDCCRYHCHMSFGEPCYTKKTAI